MHGRGAMRNKHTGVVSDKVNNQRIRLSTWVVQWKEEVCSSGASGEGVCVWWSGARDVPTAVTMRLEGVESADKARTQEPEVR